MDITGNETIGNPVDRAVELIKEMNEYAHAFPSVAVAPAGWFIVQAQEIARALAEQGR